MAIAASSRPPKNLWIAASDGDMERVRYLIEVEGMSPNAPDHNTYTPIHAAASYAHLDLLEYLLSKGGDVNILDEDGETPLFTVESKETAQWLVERGARPEIKNTEGQTAAEFLFEDHPEAAVYLQSLLVADMPPSATLEAVGVTSTSSMADAALPPNITENMTDSLMAQTDEIMRSAEESGEDPELRLRQAVGSAVLNGWGQIGGQAATDVDDKENSDARDSKRSRREDGDMDD